MLYKQESVLQINCHSLGRSGRPSYPSTPYGPAGPLGLLPTRDGRSRRRLQAKALRHLLTSLHCHLPFCFRYGDTHLLHFRKPVAPSIPLPKTKGNNGALTSDCLSPRSPPLPRFQPYKKGAPTSPQPIHALVSFLRAPNFVSMSTICLCSSPSDKLDHPLSIAAHGENPHDLLFLCTLLR
jgi:hypothetical protein